jgi:hypothetical protein
MSTAAFDVSLVNSYVAHKQHLLPTARLTGVVQVTRDIVALHATGATGPYLSLWARAPGFQRETLDDALYERRELVRALCMRSTLHVVPSDELPYSFQAYAESPAELRNLTSLLVQAGVCPEPEEEAGTYLSRLNRQVLEALRERGPSTVRQIGRAVPELTVKIQHSVGKSYAGEFSIGSRLIPSMCVQGLLVRARPQGTWRSNLYEYAALADWLPGLDLQSVTPQEARAWLVRRYLTAFGPVTIDDIQWWTGFSKGETQEALRALEPEIVKTSIEGLGTGYLMLNIDKQLLDGFASPTTPYVLLLPSLDPYIMGYRDRRRFLDPAHRAKVFDRAGNAMPTVWIGGRVAGAWGQRKDGSVIYRLFEPLGAEEAGLLAAEAGRLDDFLDGEHLRPRTHTPFTRALE